MLWTIAVILLVLWAVGLVTSYTMGGFIHVLLVIAIVVVLINVLQGPRFVERRWGASLRRALAEREVNICGTTLFRRTRGKDREHEGRYSEREMEGNQRGSQREVGQTHR